MTINLCLDTNIYLSFYHFSDNDLRRLEEILILIDNGELKILLPEQIKNEFIRNRENKISDTLKKLKTENFSFSLPRLIDSYSEKNELLSIFSQYREKITNLIKKLEQDINNHSLKADILINKIFEKALYLPLDSLIFDKAKIRYDLGNPPGKDKSYGDAIVWETLLNYGLKTQHDIDFVSIDGDYSCALNNNKLHHFLKEEWISLKQRGKFGFYSTLNEFFQEYFPGIKINQEYIKNKHIQSFCKSLSFDSTRSSLIWLRNIESFSIGEINNIIDASIENDQIYNANKYSPWVGEYIIEIIKPYHGEIDFDRLLNFYKIYDHEMYQNLYDYAMANNYVMNTDEEYGPEIYEYI